MPATKKGVGFDKALHPFFRVGNENAPPVPGVAYQVLLYE